MKMNNKLVIRKEKVSSLSNGQMNDVKGGGGKSDPSSAHPKFTCCWCSFGNTETPKTKVEK